MKVLAFHENFKLPTSASKATGAYDIYMPDSGTAHDWSSTSVRLGFAAEIPPGYVAFIFPRAPIAAKYGLELNNTCTVLDSDHRGEWVVHLKTKKQETLHWAADERILQYMLIPVLDSPPERVQSLTPANRSFSL